MRVVKKGEATFRHFEANDTAAALELMELSLGAGRSPRTPGFWRWKHLENPFGPSLGLVVPSNGQLAALRMFLCWRFHLDGQALHALRPVDTAVHPDWQRRGLFSRLTESLVDDAQARGYSLLFNTPNDRSRSGYLKMGWRDLRKSPVMVKPLRLFSLLSMMTQRSETSTAAEPTPEPQPQPCGAFPDAAATVDSARLSTPRTRDYLQWRYQRMPELEYRVATSSSGDASLVSTTLRRSGLRELRICETLLYERTAGAQGALRELLREALRTSSADIASAVAFPGTSSRALLRGLGFLPLGLFGPRIVVRPLLPALAEPAWSRAASWDLSAGDLELF
jgi:GNAT superfamily N-acetyltransferase